MEIISSHLLGSFLATDPFCQGDNLAQTLLSMVWHLLGKQHHPMTLSLFISSAPENDTWYQSQGFELVKSSNKFE